MYASLYLLAWAFVPSRLVAPTVLPLIEDVSVVAEVEEPLPFVGLDEVERRAATARLLLVWAAYESGGKVDALGDAGRSCGALQVSPFLAGVSCSAMRADRRLALRVGLTIMREAATRCGSVRRGLGAYAGGVCGARPELVLRRCRGAGVAC